jgi:hypothetical protein
MILMEVWVSLEVCLSLEVWVYREILNTYQV